ncbi:MAG: hypothetical protein LBC59_00395 [Chitinispirillales bacterium]|nr:hypothetical protein [Chitinispirillales bacterium]
MQVNGVNRYNEIQAVYAAKVNRETKSMAVVNLNEGKALSADEAIVMAEEARRNGATFKEYMDKAMKDQSADNSSPKATFQ